MAVPDRRADAAPAGRRVTDRRAAAWLAGSDSVAHAVPDRGRAPRTACGQPATGELLAWPERERCPQCLAALGLAV